MKTKQKEGTCVLSEKTINSVKSENEKEVSRIILIKKRNNLKIHLGKVCAMLMLFISIISCIVLYFDLINKDISLYSYLVFGVFFLSFNLFSLTMNILLDFNSHKKAIRI